MTYRAKLLVCAAVLGASASCGPADKNTDDHKVYFVGYVYDGATGARLNAGKLTAISLKYRDKVVNTKIEPDGRFVSLDPLPTWQDYSVFIGAQGYRAFVSNNPGIDVPRALSMTDALAGAATVQTFHYDAYLFPTTLKTAKVVFTIEKSDAATEMPTPPRAAGTLRLRPLGSSLLDRGTQSVNDGSESTSTTIVRRWSNDEDRQNNTLTKPFMEGRVEIAEGELAYGVAYEIAVFDVKGYQPVVVGVSSQQDGSAQSRTFVAGSVTSRSVTLQKELKDQLRILATNADTCMPPAGSSMAFGAEIRMTFSEEIEFVSPTAAEDIDNGVSITPPGQGASSTYCGLKMSTDPTRQERGTRATIEGNVLALAFNPSVGISPTSQYGSACMVPPALTAVTYGNLGNVQLRPKGDLTRKRALGQMVAELASGSSFGNAGISCGRSASSF